MEFDKLFSKLGDFMAKTKDSAAKTPDWTEVKNSIKQAYDAGNLTQEQYQDLNKKTTFYFKNQGRATDNLQDLIPMAKEKMAKAGNTVSEVANDLPKATALADEASQAGGFASRIGGKVGKMATMLGPLAKALAIGGGALGMMGAGQKAMAGDLTGGAVQGVDTITNFVPGLGQAKMLAEAAGLRNTANAGSTDTQNQKPYDFSKYSAEEKPSSPDQTNNSMLNKSQNGSIVPDMNPMQTLAKQNALNNISNQQDDNQVQNPTRKEDLDALMQKLKGQQ